MTDIAIKIEHLNYVYSPGTAYEKHALKDICLEIPHGEFVGIIGHTGSGKSTLIQHLNGLVKATDGALYYNGENIYQNGYDMRALRNQVGLVFQYPEYQLFEIDVLTDVCFGPKNQGLSKEECEKRALEALKLVGLKEKYYKSSPFELSGGQKRRVAIAGVLAMRPKVLVLDEPTAGLDPEERIRFRGIISDLSQQKLVLLSTHIVSDLEAVANEIILLRKGVVLEMQKPASLLEHLNGQVWLVTVPAADEAALTKQYTCSNVMHTDGKSVIRLLSKSAPRPDAVPTAPNMEDLYLYYFGR
mgnify:CR=1 FL=1